MTSWISGEYPADIYHPDCKFRAHEGRRERRRGRAARVDDERGSGKVKDTDLLLNSILKGEGYSAWSAQ